MRSRTSMSSCGSIATAKFPRICSVVSQCLMVLGPLKQLTRILARAQWYCSPLHGPALQQLPQPHAILFSQMCHIRILDQSRAFSVFWGKWTVDCSQDTFSTHVINQLGIWKPRVCLNLIAGQWDIAADRKNLPNLLDTEVGHSNGFHFARIYKLLHCTPRGFVAARFSLGRGDGFTSVLPVHNNLSVGIRSLASFRASRILKGFGMLEIPRWL